jgi:hypothetical protein
MEPPRELILAYPNLLGTKRLVFFEESLVVVVDQVSEMRFHQQV